MSVKEITCKTALHYHDRAFATNWDLNIYRGCGHRCIYCFAQYSHKYLDTDHFFDDIFVKTNISDALDSDFIKQSWSDDLVNVCGVTDAYQPLEKEYVLMPKVIETFIRRRNGMIITTKSTLLLRDIDLLEELNKVARVEVRVSASAIDESIRERIEPFSSSTVDRLQMLSRLNDRGIYTGVLMMPIIPYLTDNVENLAAIFKLSKENGAKSIIPQTLHLRGNTKQVFFTYVQKLFPKLLEKIKPLYRGSYVDKDYQENFRQKIWSLRKKYDFYNEVCERNNFRKQTSLW
ncbi:MAG: radical SAM protein [Holosporaceae bacterium]|jgi:DNA repair photolyase|nr:radical SAM protein [Holosporaceae bacterium]